jgi:hypothetical protein
MRWVSVVLVVACSKQDPAAKPMPAATGSGSVVPATDAVATAPEGVAPAPSAAVPARVDLLRAAPSEVRVSSRVHNKAIRPEHLVDRDLTTAWNSVTGELVGAWVEVRVAPGAIIDELRLTVGHTGKGPKQEDYFTMNPRIREISVHAGDAAPTRVTLDITRRDLHTVPVRATEGPVRLRVEAFAPGSKKRWREIAISELEVWGTLPHGTAPGTHTPTVVVGESKPDIAEGAIDPDAICDEFMAEHQASYDKARADSEQQRKDCRREARRNKRSPDECDTEDELAPPACGMQDLKVGPLDAPWTDLAILRTEVNTAHGPKDCQLTVSTAGGTFLIGDSVSCGPWDDSDLSVSDVTTQQLIAGGPPELVVRYSTGRDGSGTQLIACRAGDDNVRCTKPFAIEGDRYKVEPRFKAGKVTFEAAEGTPPAALRGTHPLVFE